MVRITEELIRKRSEHNESIIGTLEELSLHQEDVDKIEHINNWCKDLQILYLQANLIPKIENLNKLKKLQYLNLAVNNIEKIENLERCESLEKLDLTLNFIGDLESVCSLKDNLFLKTLYLTGNPCTDYQGYREYVIAKLPQLESLDGTAITKSEQIKAKQKEAQLEKLIKKGQEKYRKFREEQKDRIARSNASELSDEDFWKNTSEHCPEIRREISSRQKKNSNVRDLGENVPKRKVSLFNKNGRPLNINQAKLNFHFNDEDPKQYTLEIHVYKYMDTSLIDVDLQPIYVTVTIKNKYFQFVFPEEIIVDKSVAQRSQTTGHLVLKCPRMNYKEPVGRKPIEKNAIAKKNETNREYLEVEDKKDDMDFSKIVENSNKIKDLYANTDVPPLEYA